MSRTPDFLMNSYKIVCYQSIKLLFNRKIQANTRKARYICFFDNIPTISSCSSYNAWGAGTVQEKRAEARLLGW